MTQPQQNLFGTEPWEDEDKKVIRRLLEQKLGGQHIAVRPGPANSKLAYVESWKAIELANSIFGFDGWSSQIVDITPDFIEELKGGKTWRVGVTAVVKVMLKDGTFHEDVGYGISENPSKGLAIENSKKEAVSDARKRALRVFGNALGNCVYDKDHIKKVKAKIGATSNSTLTYEKLRLTGDMIETQSPSVDPGAQSGALQTSPVHTPNNQDFSDIHPPDVDLGTLQPSSTNAPMNVSPPTTPVAHPIQTHAAPTHTIAPPSFGQQTNTNPPPGVMRGPITFGGAGSAMRTRPGWNAGAK